MSHYERRFYRDRLQKTGLRTWSVQVEESDILVYCNRQIDELLRINLIQERRFLLEYCSADPLFGSSLIPCGVLSGAPEIVRMMSRASFLAGVGPMAAVAGAINDRMGSLFIDDSADFILENGGDLLVKSDQERVVGIYAGKRSPFQDHLSIVLTPGRCWGVATSSREVGPSLNFGQADSVTVLAKTAVVADAWATRLSNQIKEERDLERVLDFSTRFPEVEGVIICFQDRLGIQGQVQLIDTPGL